MARSAMLLAFLAVAGVLAVARGDGEVPTLHACEISAASLESTDFIARSLGGNAECVNAEEKGACCDQVWGLFGEGGAAEFCMCNEDFFSSMLIGLAAPNSIHPSDYVDMLKECGVPVAGRLSCPGTDVEVEVEPKVQSQIIGSLILARVLGGGGGGRGGGGDGGGEPSAPPPPPPPPPPAPAALPVAGGKKGGAKVVTLAPAGGKKGGGATMVATPAAAPVATRTAAPVAAPVATPAAPPSRPAAAPGAGGRGGGGGAPGAPGGSLLGSLVGGSG